MTAQQLRSARRLRVADPAEVLRQEISVLCEQIDRRHGNRPGTAERAVYFWWWPPDAVSSVDVLAQLHADAARFLLDAIHPEGEPTA